MQGLKIITAAAVLAALPGSLLAELKPLNSAQMGAVTGQAGITIEMETEVSIGRFAWRDEGSLTVDGIHLTDGDFSGPMDNMRYTIDVAGAGESLTYGWSELTGSGGKTFNSGDLVIHLGAADYGSGSAGDFVDAVDFGVTVDDVGLNDASGTTSTSLFSTISIQGRLGPTDVVVRNGGDAVQTLPTGNEVSESVLEFNSYFAIDDMDFDWNVGDVLLLFNFAAIGIEDMQINNLYGDDAGDNYGMASVHAKMGKGTSASTGITGLQGYDVDFRADLDLPVVRIGDENIGHVRFTDFSITNTSFLVYGH